MRKLTLKREKVMVACFAKIRIFLEDSQGDFTLSDVRCKQIGILKNGKSGEYDIPDTAVKVFVVFSKVAPQTFHCGYQIPEGSEAVTLYTGPRYNPAAGNPFSIFSKEDLERLGIRGGW